MKKMLWLMLALFVSACGKGGTMENVELAKKPAGRVAVVYFSESPNQNTKTVAGWIAATTGADIYRIEAVEPYTGGYVSILKRSRKEIKNNVLPEIKPLAVNVADYDVIFVGSPIWFGTFAPPVGTFLAGNDFTGKTVIPFCTHGGGGADNFYENVKKAAKGANVAENIFSARGSNVVERVVKRGIENKITENDVKIWLNGIL